MFGIREKQKSRPDSPRRQKSDNNRRHDEPGRYPGTARRAAEGAHPKGQQQAGLRWHRR